MRLTSYGGSYGNAHRVQKPKPVVPPPPVVEAPPAPKNEVQPIARPILYQVGVPFHRNGVPTWSVIYHARNRRGAKVQRWKSGFATQEDALLFYHEQETACSQGKLTNRVNMTVGEMADIWLEDKVKSGTVRPNTIATYDNNVRNHIKPELGDMKLNVLNQSIIYDFVETLRQKNCSPAMIARVMTSLKAILNRAVDEDYIAKNVALHVSLPKVSAKKATILTVEEIKKLMTTAIGTKIEVLVLFACAAGDRRGELLGTKFEDFNEENHSISVARQRTTNNITKKSKYAKLRNLDCSVPKTEDSQRTFKIPQYVCDAILRARKKYQWSKTHRQDFQDTGYICFNEDGTGLTPVQLDKAFKKLLEKAGLPAMRLHDLRHTAATVMINSGMSLDDVRRQLGHTTDKMTRHYTQQAIVKPEIAEKMQEIFGNALETAVQEQTPPSGKHCKSIANHARYTPI